VRFRVISWIEPLPTQGDPLNHTKDTKINLFSFILGGIYFLRTLAISAYHYNLPAWHSVSDPGLPGKPLRQIAGVGLDVLQFLWLKLDAISRRFLEKAGTALVNVPVVISKMMKA
jgi:hypothetical protein